MTSRASNVETRIEQSLSRLVREDACPGIQYAAVDHQGIRLHLEAGLSDIRNGTAVAPDTTFMASSTTKVVTAAAILQLWEARRLNLDDSASRYLNHPYGERVSIRNLLSQTSGIPNPMPLKWIHKAADHHSFNETLAFNEVLKRHGRLAFVPGERYGYSNISYWILGRIVESVSSRKFEDHVRLNIFDPLEIPPHGAGFRLDPGRHATGYQKRFSLEGLILRLMVDRRMLGPADGNRVSLVPVYMNGPAYGGLICTARGLGGFLQDCLRPEPRLFSQNVREAFLTMQQTNNGKPAGMTLGWKVGTLGAHTLLEKAGGGPGFRSNARLYPGLGLATAWLANETGVNERQMNSISNTLDRHWLGIEE